MNLWERSNAVVRKHPLFIHIILVLGIGITLYANSETSAKVDKSTNNTLGTIVAVQVDNCKNDLIFRKQYKIRGDAEKQLLTLFVSLARSQLALLPPDDPQRKVSEDFIEQFSPLTSRIRVIPVPDCRAVQKHLKEVLGPDVVVPSIHTGKEVGGKPPAYRPVKPGQ